MSSIATFESWFEKTSKVLVALSGGVDSCLVAFLSPKVSWKNFCTSCDFGFCQFKKSKTPSGKTKYKPESSDVFKIAKQTGERPLYIELKSKIIIENEKD